MVLELLYFADVELIAASLLMFCAEWEKYYLCNLKKTKSLLDFYFTSSTGGIEGITRIINS